MSYREALEAAEAKVMEYKEFGSYQGAWLARVVTESGNTGWVVGSYGSCSGCDSFLAEFGYQAKQCDAHLDDWEDDPEVKECEDCHAVLGDYYRRLADFGRSYLDTLYTIEELVERFGPDSHWDDGAADIIRFLTNR